MSGAGLSACEHASSSLLSHPACPCLLGLLTRSSDGSIWLAAPFPWKQKCFLWNMVVCAHVCTPHPHPQASWHLKCWWEVLDFSVKRVLDTGFILCGGDVKNDLHGSEDLCWKELSPWLTFVPVSTSCPGMSINSALGCDDKLLGHS